MLAKTLTNFQKMFQFLLGNFFSFETVKMVEEHDKLASNQGSF